MVAKSYQGMEIVSEPFSMRSSSKRGYYQMYVTVKTGKFNADGSPVTRDVRWYTEDEYYKMYPDEKPAREKFNAKVAFGFDKGFIWVFKGDTFAQLDWFRECKITQYAKHLGWFIKSKWDLPEDIPEGIEPVVLTWESVSDGNDEMLPYDQVKQIVYNLTHPVDPNAPVSEYQGEIGGKLTVTAKCTVSREVSGPYGTSTLHNFVDADGNIYVWFTQAKQLDVGTTYTFSCKVKDHKEFRDQKQTIINYLRNIKEVEDE